MVDEMVDGSYKPDLKDLDKKRKKSEGKRSNSILYDLDNEKKKYNESEVFFPEIENKCETIEEIRGQNTDIHSDFNDAGLYAINDDI